MRGPGAGTGKAGRRGRGEAIRRALALAGATAIFAGLAGGSAAAEPWGFEQVSPFDKGAGTVSGFSTFTAAPDGETFLYTAIGSFDEVPSKSVPIYTRYFAERGEDRWHSRPVDPPYDLRKDGVIIQFPTMATLRTSENLRYSFISTLRALTPGATQGGSNHYIQDNRTGELTLVMTGSDPRETEVLTGLQGQTGVYWVAPDGKAALFNRTYDEGESKAGLYQWTAEDGLERIPDVEWEGQSHRVGSTANLESGTRERFPREDGLTRLYLGTATSLSTPSKTPVVLRHEGKNKFVSVSQREEDKGTPVKAYLQTVSEGGKFATFFTHEGRRLTDDSPEGANYYLYRYDAEKDDLKYVAHQTGTSAGFKILQSSPDGQTIAFTARDVLAPGAKEASAPRVNVYVWRNGVTKYVYTTDDPSAMNGVPPMSTLSPSGRYLYFTDTSQSLAASFGTETLSVACADAATPAVPANCHQAYLYDADTGKLDCLSCNGGTAKGHGGDPSSGNSAGLFFNGRQSWNVTDEGRAFFSTAEALLPQDTNGLEDVYEFHQGTYRLVTPAKAGHRYRFVDASRDGSAIFFTTTDPIVPQDEDTVVDLYVTREGAGFPYNPPPVTPPCLGVESCHGGPSVGPAVPGASTSTFQGKPNPRIVVGKVSLGKATARGARLRVTVRVSGPGKLRLAGNRVKGVVRKVGKAGRYRIAVSLTGKGRRALKAKGRLRSKLNVRFTPEEGRGAQASRAYVFKSGKRGG